MLLHIECTELASSCSVSMGQRYTKNMRICAFSWNYGNKMVYLYDI